MKPIDTAGENPTQPAGGGGRAPGAARTPPLEISAGDNATFAVTPDSAVEFKAGAVVADQFEVVRLVGRGGMGAVYEVRDQLSGQKLALKTILPSILAKPNAASRFVQEVTTARQLRHPGIVAVYDLRKSGPLLFFTMEYLEGRTLRAELSARGRLPLDETARILAELCDALAYAHQYTVHRDLSPENVMILPGGRLKLLDFGIAKTLDPSSFTSSNMAMGKAYYMAPEQRRDASRVDARADIWSLGVLFFEMLSGEMPVGYGKLTDLVPELPADCERLVERSITPLQKRFESVHEFLDALQYCVPHLVLRRGVREDGHAFPSRTDVPETLQKMAREFVARQKGEWGKAEYTDFCLGVYEHPGHVGITRESITVLLEQEKAVWIDREARRKAEEARRAEEQRKAIEEAERRRKEAEEARRRQELHEKTRALRAEARDAFDKGEYEKAVQAWEGVLQNLPDDEEAGQQIENARRALRKAEAEHKRDEDVRCNAGQQTVPSGGGAGVWIVGLVILLLFAGVAVLVSQEGSTRTTTSSMTRPSASEQSVTPTTAASTPENAVELQRASAPDGEIARTVDLGGGVKLDLVWIPPGTFMMGSPSSEEGRSDHEGPQHQVELTRGFWMGKCEVTQAQWESVMGSNPSHFKGADRPVEQVSWDDCQSFLQRLNSRVSGGGFRLPTEAEWEYACRAGTTTPFHFGEIISTDQANYDGDYTYGNGRKGVRRCETTPVGSFPANAWGLNDMHGNVWEWCQDWYAADFYSRSPARDPENTTKSAHRVLRGGSWFFDPRVCRSAFRDGYLPEYSFDWGFRVVLVASRAS